MFDFEGIMSNKVKCEYNECKLPKTNRRFLIQTIYLIISALIFLKNAEDFTFFPILMYTAPIIIDLCYNDVEIKFIEIIKWFFIALNLILGIFCILGWNGIIIDNGDSFSLVETALIDVDFVINKHWLFWPLCSNILVPIIFFFGCPTQKVNKVIKFFRKEKSGAT